MASLLTTEVTAQQRILGGLLGVAAGDALGATVEFMAPDKIAQTGRHSEIVGGGVFGWRPGQGTDDTDMTAGVARAYATGYTLEQVATEFGAWYRTRPRDIGGMTSRALRVLDRTSDPAISGAVALRSSGTSTAGNGSLMRALPTALARSDSRQRRSEAAEISAITHADPRCVQACVAYVEIASSLIDAGTPAGAIATAAAAVTDPGVLDALAVDPAAPLDTLRTGGFVLDSLRVAVWAIQQPCALESLVVDIVNRGDDADTTGAIAGGLLGVRDGVDAIPTRWIQKLEYTTEFTTLAASLAVLRAS